MKIRANHILLTAAMLLMAPIATVKAERTAYKLPAIHQAAAGNAEAAMASPEIDNIRKASPFAEIAQEKERQLKHENLNKAIAMSDYAAKFLGTRYRLGATGPKAFDCSGFVGYVYKKFGINLLRDSRSQYTQGSSVHRGDYQPGDLLFFKSRSSRGAVGHVGMVVDVKEDGSCTFIHASTKKGVTYQSFPDNGYYSRNFVGAKRILE